MENLGDIKEDLFEDTKVQDEFSEAKFGNRNTGEEENKIMDKLESSEDVKPVTKEEFVMLMAEFREEIFKDFWTKDEDG